jgi:hypothetical protein
VGQLRRAVGRRVQQKGSNVNLVPLNAQEHADVRVRNRPPDIPHFVEITAEEFVAAAAICPVLLAKNPETGAFYAGAMFGFKPGENLFGTSEGRPAPYVPLDRQRAGFYVSGEHIVIDLDDPRFTTSAPDGEPLFEVGGQPGPVLRHMQRIIGQLVRGKAETDALVAELLELKLIEPIDVSLQFDDGETLVLDGLYTVSLDALRDIADQQALKLFRNGQLQLIYALSGSLRQIPVLAERRNRMLAGGV